MQEKVYNMPNGSKVRTHTNGSSPYGGKPNTVSALTMKLEGDKERAGDNGLSLRRETSKSSRNSKNSKSSKSSKASKASKASLTLPPKEVLSPGGNLNSSRHKNVHAMAGIYGYNERDDDESDPEEEAETLLYEKDTEAEPSFMTALRGGGLSKSESEQKLAQQLSQVAQVKDYSGKDDRLQTLKEKFGGSKRSLKPRAERRLSSSSASSSQYSAQSFSQSSFALSQNDSFADLSVDLLESSKRSEMSFNFTASSHTSTSLNAFNMSNYSQKGDSSFNMSANTLPATNVVKSAPADNKKNAVKTDQIIESLVWFSFHTPRAVLEDLISHEMDLWRAQRIKSSRRVLTVQEKMAGKRLDDDDDSCSTISDEGGAHEIFGKNFSETMMQMKVKKTELNMLDLPKCVERESALLFVDMSGFTKLSTMLDVESFAKVINSYFDMIVSEVILYGGDILKFAGDAFFAEWKVVEDDETEEGYRDNPLAHLNASLASINEFNWDDDDDIPKLSSCVLSAAKCGAAIVRKFSDYQVTCLGAEKTMLNVHCGIGVGDLVGLHIGDFKEDQEEEGVELRREFLILGEPIDQVSKAADIAKDGEVLASPEAMLSLAFVCDMPDAARCSTEPVCIASRGKDFLKLGSAVPAGSGGVGAALQPYESLRMHCKSLSYAALARLHMQMALYVHPVIRGDELALSAAIQSGNISQPTETLESRHRAQAELRSVYTIFIKAVLTPRVTGMKEVDEDLYKTLGDIMHVTSRELDRYSGHLRQFIVDDKGVVLLATFGLRGSTFPKMVANNALPATFAIHRALKTELNVENRIGATFGKVYCGIVGGVRRHEFAVMGAPVNLAARLMSSKENNGILVDEAVRAQAGNRFAFRSLPPVKAKGYDKPVPILEPLNSVEKRKKKSSVAFVGRNAEKFAITSIAERILETPFQAQSAMVFLMGELGMGKSALALSVMEDIKKLAEDKHSVIATARSTSTETEQRIPLSSYRKIFISVVENIFERDDSTVGGNSTVCGSGDGEKSLASKESKGSIGFSLRSMHSLERRKGFLSMTTKGRLMATDEDEERSATTDEVDRRHSLIKTPRTPGGLGIDDQLRMLPGPERKAVDPEEMSFASLSQSLRDISADLQSSPMQSRLRLNRHESSKKFLPNSLSKSIHGDAGSIGPAVRRMSDALGNNSLHNMPMSMSRSPGFTTPIPRQHSVRLGQSALKGVNDDSSVASGDDRGGRGGPVPYFEKLCLVCEEMDYPYEYADIVGSQFLGLDGASPVTHVDGHIPTMDELIEFLAVALICIADYADLSVILVDDFQWVDSFSWKIFRAICKRGKKLLMICAMRSHDKQALRRLSTAVTQQSELQSIEVSLGPLDFSEIRSLMANMLVHSEKAIPDALCTDIFQRTGGLPVYVVQLLENIKRKKTLELEGGILKWNAEGSRDMRAMASNKNGNGAFMEEAFLSRFDGLDVRVRKVLQTCAVLGLSFALSDVIRVHPELEEADIEKALDSSVDEMVLIEQVEDDEEDDDDDDDVSFQSHSTGESSGESNPDTYNRSGRSVVTRAPQDRFFQFSHAMWRNNVLTTMLKERKIELHRSIAEAMEKDQVLIMEQSDISRLLTLFDHWKSCGDFSKSAPLALAVGARLEEWDLSAQSLELYEDALEMAFDSVQAISGDNGESKDEWVQVSAKPGVWDLILRLHIRVGLCHQQLGEDFESISYFEDAFNIIKSSSKIPGISKSLMMPILSTLAVLKLDQETEDSQTKKDQEKLLKTFVREAKKNGNPVHIGRALSLEAKYFAKLGRLDRALEDVEKLRSSYDIIKHSPDMVAEYGRDFALECISESVQWLYLKEDHEEAEIQADLFIKDYLPVMVLADTDNMMSAIFPILHVLMLLDRANDADWLLKKYAINAYHDSGSGESTWVTMFNPLAYLLEVILMEDSENDVDWQLLEEMAEWALDEENGEFDLDLERKAHTIMGELCWRLANFKEEDDSSRDVLLERARDLLNPVAIYPHPEIFLKQSAQALLKAL